MSRNLTLQVLRGLKANAPTLAVAESYFCTDTKQWLTGTAGGNVVVAPFPIYNSSGTLQQNVHMVYDRITMTGSTQTITLSGSAIFTSATSYDVFVTDAQVKRTLNVVQNSGSSFTISGGGAGDVLTYLCIGT